MDYLDCIYVLEVALGRFAMVFFRRADMFNGVKSCRGFVKHFTTKQVYSAANRSTAQHLYTFKHGIGCYEDPPRDDRQRYYMTVVLRRVSQFDASVRRDKGPC